MATSWYHGKMNGNEVRQQIGRGSGHTFSPDASDLMGEYILQRFLIALMIILSIAAATMVLVDVFRDRHRDEAADQFVSEVNEALLNKDLRHFNSNGTLLDPATQLVGSYETDLKIAKTDETFSYYEYMITHRGSSVARLDVIYSADGPKVHGLYLLQAESNETKAK